MRLDTCLLCHSECLLCHSESLSHFSASAQNYSIRRHLYPTSSLSSSMGARKGCSFNGCAQRVLFQWVFSKLLYLALSSSEFVCLVQLTTSETSSISLYLVVIWVLQGMYWVLQGMYWVLHGMYWVLHGMFCMVCTEFCMVCTEFCMVCTTNTRALTCQSFWQVKGGRCLCV
jgi:hypothetical protein